MAWKSTAAALSYAARRTVWALLCRHTPGPYPPIVIFTSRRSGGTWLTDALSAEAGLLSVLQPFAIGLSDPFLRADGGFPESLLENARTPIRPHDEAWMRPFLQRIFDGELRIGWPANPLSSRFQFRTNRVLVKVHNAKVWIDWIEHEFPEARIVLHLRHPIPQALSAMQMGWPDRTEAYLKDEVFVERHLSPELEQTAREISSTGTAFERAILGWLIENRAPLRLLEDNPSSRWLTTTYEETIANPEAVFERLLTHLDLRNRDAILTRALRPSHTVFDPSKRDQIRHAAEDAGMRSKLIDGWQGRATAAQVEQAERLFELFGLRCYRADSPYPSSALWLTPRPFGLIQ